MSKVRDAERKSDYENCLKTICDRMCGKGWFTGAECMKETGFSDQRIRAYLGKALLDGDSRYRIEKKRCEDKLLRWLVSDEVTVEFSSSPDISPIARLLTSGTPMRYEVAA